MCVCVCGGGYVCVCLVGDEGVEDEQLVKMEEKGVKS